MIRIILLAILFLLIAQAFWRVVEGIVHGAGGSARRKPSIKPSLKLVRDPVCGTFVAPRPELSLTAGDETHYFCSDRCRREFRP